MAASEARMASMREQNSSSTKEVTGYIDISATEAGKRGRPAVLIKRRNRDAFRADLAADKDVVREHARWWNPEL